MKKIIKIIEHNIDPLNKFIVNKYFLNGFYEFADDPSNYFIPDFNGQVVWTIPKTTILNLPDFEEPKEVLTAAGVTIESDNRISVDEAIRLIAIAKDSRLVDKVIKNPNK